MDLGQAGCAQRLGLETGEHLLRLENSKILVKLFRNLTYSCSYLFAQFLPELPVLVESDVLLPLPVTAEAGEVADELPAGALLALGPHRVVDGVRVFAATEGSPLGHVKPFTTN